ncbi:type I-E CRISPR-associated protein Cse1/CasA [Streptomyces sp. 372A]
MPTDTNNLIDQPYIPVRRTPKNPPADTVAGLPGRVRFRELLPCSQDIETHAIADAPADAALLRLLHAITPRGRRPDRASQETAKPL